jgi:hypothetical protein
LIGYQLPPLIIDCEKAWHGYVSAKTVVYDFGNVVESLNLHVIYKKLLQHGGLNLSAFLHGNRGYRCSDLHARRPHLSHPLRLS